MEARVGDRNYQQKLLNSFFFSPRRGILNGLVVPQMVILTTGMFVNPFSQGPPKINPSLLSPQSVPV